MPTMKAPAGYSHSKPLVIDGRPFVGGEFVPSHYVASATPEQMGELVKANPGAAKQVKPGQQGQVAGQTAGSAAPPIGRPQAGQQFQSKAFSTPQESKEWMSGHFGDYQDNLTGNQIKSIGHYATDEGYAQIDKFLQSPESISASQHAEIKSHVENMDAAIGQTKTREPITVFRGLPTKRDPQSLVGQTLTDKGYASTSLDRGQVLGEGGESSPEEAGAGAVGMQIHVPAGTGTLPLGGSSSEMVLPRNSDFKITHAEQDKSGRWMLRAELQPKGNAPSDALKKLASEAEHAAKTGSPLPHDWVDRQVAARQALKGTPAIGDPAGRQQRPLASPGQGVPGQSPSTGPAVTRPKGVTEGPFGAGSIPAAKAIPDAVRQKMAQIPNAARLANRYEYHAVNRGLNPADVHNRAMANFERMPAKVAGVDQPPEQRLHQAYADAMKQSREQTGPIAGTPEGVNIRGKAKGAGYIEKGKNIPPTVAQKLAQTPHASRLANRFEHYATQRGLDAKKLHERAAAIFDKLPKSGPTAVPPKQGWHQSYTQAMADEMKAKKPPFLPSMAAKGWTLPPDTGLASGIQTPQVHTEPFKKWFGDWKDNPSQSSKVVDPNTGQPQIVFHGTPSGGFNEFNAEKTSDANLYGKGLYFTEDQMLSNEYTKDKIGNAPSKNPQVYAVHLNIRKPFDMDKKYSRADAEKKIGDLLGEKLGWFGKLTASPEYKKSIDGLHEIEDEDGLERKSSFSGDEIYKAITSGLTMAHLKSPDFADRMLRAKTDATKLLQKAGYDGITHIGGNLAGGGVREHRVWIAFNPKQVKSIKNKGEYSPESANIMASMSAKGLSLPPESGLPSGIKQELQHATQALHDKLTEHGQAFLNKAFESVQRSANLTAEQKAYHFGSLAKIIGRMTPTAQQRIAAHVPSVTYHSTPQALTNELAKKWEMFAQDASREHWASGCMMLASENGVRAGELYMDGDAEHYLLFGGNVGKLEGIGHVQSHELWHGIDGPDLKLSSSDEWREAWADEIEPPMFDVNGERISTLSGYASSNPHEGFAEMGRLIDGAKMEPAQIEKLFPRCVAFLKSQGLWAGV